MHSSPQNGAARNTIGTRIKMNRKAVRKAHRNFANVIGTLLVMAGSKAGAATLNGGFVILAQTNFNTSMSSALGVINSICAVLCFGALISAVIMYMMGRTEYMKQALVGAAVAGLSWVIVQTFFSAGGQSVSGITVTAPQ